MRNVFLSAILVCLTAVMAEAAGGGRRTVIYDQVATEVGAAAEPGSDLWVTMQDLKRATRFVVKPRGVCRDELCFPLPKARKAEFIARREAATRFNLSAFARLIKQPVAFDEKHQVWYFGPPAQAIHDRLASLEAIDFTLPDMSGKRHSLSDFRGKKVLLLTWASW